jgi:hypothetical protein
MTPLYGLRMIAIFEFNFALYCRSIMKCTLLGDSKAISTQYPEGDPLMEPLSVCFAGADSADQDGYELGIMCGSTTYVKGVSQTLRARQSTPRFGTICQRGVMQGSQTWDP